MWVQSGYFKAHLFDDDLKWRMDPLSIIFLYNQGFAFLRNQMHTFFEGRGHYCLASPILSRFGQRVYFDFESCSPLLHKVYAAFFDDFPGHFPLRIPFRQLQALWDRDNILETCDLVLPDFKICWKGLLDGTLVIDFDHEGSPVITDGILRYYKLTDNRFLILLSLPLPKLRAKLLSDYGFIIPYLFDYLEDLWERADLSEDERLCTLL